MAVTIGDPRVRLRGTFLAECTTIGVVGAGDIDLAGHRARLDIFAAIHFGRADGIRYQTGVHERVVSAETGNLADPVDDERHPLAGAVELPVGGQLAGAGDVAGRRVAGEAGHVQGAAGEQRLVVGARLRALLLVEAVEGDELVEVVESLVVAHVGGHMAGLSDDDVGTLVLEPAECRVLDRRLVRCLGVDLHDPAEPVRFVLVAGYGGVEPVVDSLPEPAGWAIGQAVAGIRCAGARRAKVAVEVLLTGEHRSPGCGTAGAVAEGTEHGASRGVGSGLQQVAAGGRAGDGERGARGDAAVEAVAHAVGPGRAGALPFEGDDGHAVSHHGDATLLIRFGRCSGRRKHDALVGVLMVGDEDAVTALAARALENVEVVVVVAKLECLQRGRLVVGVKRIRGSEQRVTPADDRVPGVARGNHDRVDGGRNRGNGREREAAASRSARRSQRGGGLARPEHDRGGANAHTHQ